MTFGEKIKKLREKKRMSQRQLGEQLGVRQQTVAQYEKIIDTPKMDTVRRIAAALDVDLTELVSPEEIMEGLTYQGGGFYGKEAPKEVYDKFMQRLTDKKSEISRKIDVLNSTGQQKALDYVDDLSKIPEYRKEPEPDTPDTPE